MQLPSKPNKTRHGEETTNPGPRRATLQNVDLSWAFEARAVCGAVDAFPSSLYFCFTHLSSIYHMDVLGKNPHGQIDFPAKLDLSVVQ